MGDNNVRNQTYPYGLKIGGEWRRGYHVWAVSKGAAATQIAADNGLDRLPPDYKVLRLEMVPV